MPQICIRKTRRCYPVASENSDMRDYENGNLLWAKILKIIRSDNQTLLFAACSDIGSGSVWMEKGALCLMCDESQYALFSQKSNTEYLSKIISGEANAKLVLSKRPKTVTLDEEIRDIQRILGEKLKIVK